MRKSLKQLVNNETDRTRWNVSTSPGAPTKHTDMLTGWLADWLICRHADMQTYRHADWLTCRQIAKIQVLRYHRDRADTFPDNLVCWCCQIIGQYEKGFSVTNSGLKNRIWICLSGSLNKMFSFYQGLFNGSRFAVRMVKHFHGINMLETSSQITSSQSQSSVPKSPVPMSPVPKFQVTKSPVLESPVPESPVTNQHHGPFTVLMELFYIGTVHWIAGIDFIALLLGTVSKLSVVFKRLKFKQCLI